MIERRILLAWLRSVADLPTRRRDRWAVSWAQLRSPRRFQRAAGEFMREALEVWERWRLDGLRPPASSEDQEILAPFALYWAKVARDPALSDRLADSILVGLGRTFVESSASDPERAEEALRAYFEGHELRRRGADQP